MTNDNIENVNGWSEMQIINTHTTEKKFWIDFWILQDGDNMYMFYADQLGSLLYIKCPIEKFPNGFKRSESKIAFTQTGVKHSLEWKMFEAAHVYFAKKENKFIAIGEGAYGHPINRKAGDARSRFLFAMIADSIEGEWTRLEEGLNTFFVDPENLFKIDGSKPTNSMISHPELIRAGCNQKLEIENIEDIQMIYETFDATKTPDTFNYHALPWRLSVMKRTKD